MSEDIERVSLMESIHKAIENPNKEIKVLDTSQVSFDFLVKLQYQLRDILKQNDINYMRVIVDTSVGVRSIYDTRPHFDKLLLLYIPEQGDLQ